MVLAELVCAVIRLRQATAVVVAKQNVKYCVFAGADLSIVVMALLLHH